MHTMRRVKHMKEDEEGAKHTTKSSTHRPFSVSLSLFVFSVLRWVFMGLREKNTLNVSRELVNEGKAYTQPRLYQPKAMDGKCSMWNWFVFSFLKHFISICVLLYCRRRCCCFSSSSFFLWQKIPSLSLYATACFHLCSLIILDASIIDSSTRLSRVA